MRFKRPSVASLKDTRAADRRAKLNLSRARAARSFGLSAPGSLSFGVWQTIQAVLPQSRAAKRRGEPVAMRRCASSKKSWDRSSRRPMVRSIRSLLLPWVSSIRDLLVHIGVVGNVIESRVAFGHGQSTVDNGFAKALCSSINSTSKCQTSSLGGSSGAKVFGSERVVAHSDERRFEAASFDGRARSRSVKLVRTRNRLSGVVPSRRDRPQELMASSASLATGVSKVQRSYAALLIRIRYKIALRRMKTRRADATSRRRCAQSP